MGKYYDPTRAMYSSYAAGSEANGAMNMIKKNPQKMLALKIFFEKADMLLDRYKSVLSLENITRAKNFMWDYSGSYELYSEIFFANVILNYRIWEISQIEFESLRTAVKENNPEWYGRFMKDAGAKIRTSVRKIGIDIN